MVVKAEQDVALFAHVESATLANLALLTGTTQEFELLVARVTDYDATDARTVGVSTAECGTSASASILALSGCTVVLSTASSVFVVGSEWARAS